MNAPWYRLLGSRITVLWVLKGMGTTLFMTLFFWAYFSILEHLPSAPVVVPALPFDHWVPLTPWAYLVYISLWVYVSIPPALMAEFRSLAHYGAWMLAMCMLCLAIFWFYPTQTPSFGIDWRLYPGLSQIKSVDAGGNAWPSLHVASAVFSAFWLQRILTSVRAPAWPKWLNALQCLAIAWSTLATRQHVVLDVMAGALIGAAFAWASLRRPSTS